MLKLLCVVLSGLAGPVFAEADTDATKVTVKMVVGITSSRQLGSEGLRNARRSLARGQFVRAAQLRQLADLGDGFAALRFAQRLENAEYETRPSDVAHYYGIAAATGRGGAITGLIKTLEGMDPSAMSPRRLAVLKNIILTYARAGNSYAVEAVLRFHRSGKPFGALDEEMIALVDQAVGESAAAMALEMGMSILQESDRSLEQLQLAEVYLAKASLSDSLETRLIARNLSPMLQAALETQAAMKSEVNP